MFIPIFIPINHFNDDSDDYRSNKHGYDCRCSKCLEKERYENMPREYYYERYAVPKSFIRKNNILRILKYVLGGIGILTVVSPIFLSDYFQDYFWLLICLIPFGMLITISTVIIFDKYIKYDFQCDDKIYLQLEGFSDSEEEWKKLIEKENIDLKKHKLTETKLDWGYK